MPDWYPVIRPGDRAYVADLPMRIRECLKKLPRVLRADYPAGWPNGGVQLYEFFGRGTGYQIGDIVTGVGGNNNAIARVFMTDSGSGAVVGLRFINPGTGYLVGILTMSGGSGAGLQIKVTEVA